MPIKHSCILLLISLSQFFLKMNTTVQFSWVCRWLLRCMDWWQQSLVGASSFGRVDATSSQGKWHTAHCTHSRSTCSSVACMCQMLCFSFCEYQSGFWLSSFDPRSCVYFCQWGLGSIVLLEKLPCALNLKHVWTWNIFTDLLLTHVLQISIKLCQYPGENLCGGWEIFFSKVTSSELGSESSSGFLNKSAHWSNNKVGLEIAVLSWLEKWFVKGQNIPVR